MQTIDIQIKPFAADVAYRSLTIRVSYRRGTVAVHRIVDHTGRVTSSDRWRLTHVPSGARITDLREYAKARALARRLGLHPAFGPGLHYDSPREARRPAYEALRDALADLGVQS